MNVRAAKFEILSALASMRHAHKFTLIGRGSDRGDLERRLNVTFGPEDRERADIALEELRAAGLIRCTYSDLVDPEAWVAITDSGRVALERRCLDPLDQALFSISPTLVELRDGAWAAIASARPDSLRQAAHSARELVDQALKSGAPDDVIRSMPGFKPDASSRSGITRRHRLQFLMTVRRGRISESDLKVAEKACDLVLAVDDRLKALAHSRDIPEVSDVKDALSAAEIALRHLLLSGGRFDD